MKNISLDILS